MTHLESTILDLLQLHQGRENAIELNNLCSQLMMNERKVRDVMADLRLQGEPVISLGNGYFYAVNDAEKREYIRRERGKALSILTGIKGIDPKSREIVNQLSLL